MNYLKLDANDVFVDLGCGKGRAVFLAAAQKLKKVIGVELRKELADIAVFFPHIGGELQIIMSGSCAGLSPAPLALYILV